MELAILIPTLTIGGAETIALNTAIEISKSGINVTMILLENKIELSVPENIKVHVIPSGNFISKMIDFIGFLKSKDFQFCLSYMERANFINVISSVIIPINTKFCLSVHTAPKNGFKLRGNLNKFFTYITYKLACYKSIKVIAVSSGIASDLYSIYKVKNCKTIPNFICKDHVRALSLVKGGDVLDKEKINVTFVGRLNKVKGCHIALKALKKLPIGHNIKLNIIGDGPESEKLKDLSVNYDNSVKYFGSIINPYPIMKDSDWIVVPSYAEGFGMVILESLVLNKKIIYSECDFGPREILSNDVSFMGKAFYDPSINEELAIDSLVEILNELDKYKLTNKEVEIVNSSLSVNYSPSNVVKEIIDYLKE